MREQMEQRLSELRGEYESGRRMLEELEARQRSLQETMLRIAGAMQVIEELLRSPEGAQPTGGAQDEQALVS